MIERELTVSTKSRQREEALDGLKHGFWTLECVFRGNVGIHRAPKAIQVDGSRPRRVSLPGFPRSSLSGTLASYGASAVARTSGRGHVAEA